MKNEENKRYKAEISLAQIHPDTPSLDLHGYTAFDAEYEVDAFLDREARSGSLVVKIIHGKGKGILQDVVKDFLSIHPLVAYMEPAMGNYESGAVYYVVLKN